MKSPKYKEDDEKALKQKFIVDAELEKNVKAFQKK